jgi:L-amino acid N-acyltransferase YncA
MEFSSRVEFDHGDRSDIYNHVERSGTVGYERAREALEMSHEAFGHHVAVLRREGVITETDEGKLRVAFERGAGETYDADDGMAVTIRQAREEDLEGLVAVIREALTDETYIEAETLADTIELESVLLRHNELMKRVVFLAKVDDEVVGWTHADARELDALDHTAEVTVGVVEPHRGRGIGSKLLDKSVDWALDHGFEKLYNSVPATNERAVSFLESRGWETEAVREGHYRIDGEYVDELMMAKRLG